MNVIDSGIKYTNSEVWSEKLSSGGINIDSEYASSMKGDAVSVKTPRGIFFLLPSGDFENLGAAEMLPERLFSDIADRAKPNRVDAIRLISREGGLQRDLSCNYNGGVNDSLVGTVVHQGPNCLVLGFTKNPDNKVAFHQIELGGLKRILGDSVKIESVVISITHDRVTRDIDRVLPWTSQLSGAYTYRASEDRDGLLNGSESYLRR